MKKKILAVVLGLTLCFGMTGCTNVVNIDKTIKSPNFHLHKILGLLILQFVSLYSFDFLSYSLII